jgi:hypothetical protein
VAATVPTVQRQISAGTRQQTANGASPDSAAPLPSPSSITSPVSEQAMYEGLQDRCSCLMLFRLCDVSSLLCLLLSPVRSPLPLSLLPCLASSGRKAAPSAAGRRDSTVSIRRAVGYSMQSQRTEPSEVRYPCSDLLSLTSLRQLPAPVQRAHCKGSSALTPRTAPTRSAATVLLSYLSGLQLSRSSRWPMSRGGEDRSRGKRSRKPRPATRHRMPLTVRDARSPSE